MRDFAILELDHISKAFPSAAALDDAPFDFRKGAVHALFMIDAYQKTIATIHQEIQIKNPRYAQQQGISLIYHSGGKIFLKNNTLVFL